MAGCAVSTSGTETKSNSGAVIIKSRRVSHGENRQTHISSDRSASAQGRRTDQQRNDNVRGTQEARPERLRVPPVRQRTGVAIEVAGARRGWRRAWLDERGCVPEEAEAR